MIEGLTLFIESLPNPVFWSIYFFVSFINLYCMVRFLGYGSIKWGRIQYGYLVAGLIVVNIATTFTSQANGWLNLYWVCIMPVLYTALVSLVVDGYNKVFVTVLAFLLESMSLVPSLFAVVFSGSLPMFYEDNIQLLTSGLSVTLMVVPLYLWFTIKNKVVLFNLKTLDKKHLLIILIGIVIAEFFGGTFHALSGLRHDTFQSHAVTSAYAMMIASVAAILTMFLNENIEKHRYLEKAIVNETLVEKQRQYYALLLDKEKETKRFRHDINNHFACINYFLENGAYAEAKNYVGEVIQRAEGLTPLMETGNEILNAVVIDLLNQFKDVNFKINWAGRFPADVNIASADLCIIFSNAITNAIEAVKKLNSSEVETIDVTVKPIGANLYVLIQNPCVNSSASQGGRHGTDKPDKASHGFGIQRITECIEQYGGSVNFVKVVNSFLVEMIFFEAGLLKKTAAVHASSL